MKLYCLGTSHGVPETGRFTSCHVLEVGEKLYIFDTGAPVVDLLLRKGKNINKIRGFFCSHFHGDHMDGGVSLLTLCDWYFKETDFEAWLPDRVTENTLRLYAEACDDVTFADGRIKLRVTEPGCIYDDGTVRVTAIPVGHIVRPDKRSYAFSVEAEGKKFLYTGDLSYRLKKEDFPAVAMKNHYDLILTECAHFPVATLESYMARVDTEVFAVSHVFPLEKYEQMKALEGKYPFRLWLPNDGDEMEIENR